MNRNQWGGEADKNIPHLNHYVWERVRKHRTSEEKKKLIWDVWKIMGAGKH